MIGKWGALGVTVGLILVLGFLILGSVEVWDRVAIERIHSATDERIAALAAALFAGFLLTLGKLAVGAQDGVLPPECRSETSEQLEAVTGRHGPSVAAVGLLILGLAVGLALLLVRR